MLCQFYGCLPSQLVDEDADLMIRYMIAARMMERRSNG